MKNITENRKKVCDCENCVHAEIAKEYREIKKGSCTIYQQPGSVNCTCDLIHSFTVTDDGMICSEYEEAEK